jgi:hypothetical protein
MAITQGINGTFSPYQEIEDVEPVYFTKLKKTVPDGNYGWEERTFYALTKNVSPAVRWLHRHYGEANYCNTWWYTPDKVVMSEKIYTHYALSV